MSGPPQNNSSTSPLQPPLNVVMSNDVRVNCVTVVIKLISYSPLSSKIRVGLDDVGVHPLGVSL